MSTKWLLPSYRLFSLFPGLMTVLGFMQLNVNPQVQTEIVIGEQQGLYQKDLVLLLLENSLWIPHFYQIQTNLAFWKNLQRHGLLLYLED